MLVVGAVIVWHIASLNSLALYTGVYLETWLIAPRGVILNKYHLIGVALAMSGTAIVTISVALGLLDYGILFGGFFIVFDPFFIYAALMNYKRQKP